MSAFCKSGHIEWCYSGVCDCTYDIARGTTNYIKQHSIEKSKCDMYQNWP